MAESPAPTEPPKPPSWRLEFYIGTAEGEKVIYIPFDGEYTEAAGIVIAAAGAREPFIHAIAVTHVKGAPDVQEGKRMFFAPLLMVTRALDDELAKQIPAFKSKQIAVVNPDADTFRDIIKGQHKAMEEQKKKMDAEGGAKKYGVPIGKEIGKPEEGPKSP